MSLPGPCPSPSPSPRSRVRRSAAQRLGWLLAAIILGTAQAAEVPAVDPASGLVEAGDWTLVAAHCGSCHSTKLVTQNRGTRETWKSLIRWMQDSQGLWQLDAETEKRILDYLETHYGPRDAGRRRPLPPHLMPPSPHDDT